jgi:hypothetical protein
VKRKVRRMGNGNKERGGGERRVITEREKREKRKEKRERRREKEEEPGLVSLALFVSFTFSFSFSFFPLPPAFLTQFLLPFLPLPCFSLSPFSSFYASSSTPSFLRTRYRAYHEKSEKTNCKKINMKDKPGFFECCILQIQDLITSTKVNALPKRNAGSFKNYRLRRYFRSL